MSRSFGCLAASSLLLATVGCDFKLNIAPPPPVQPAPVATPGSTGPPPETNNALIQANRYAKEAALTMEMSQIPKLMMIQAMTGVPLPKDYDAAIASDPNAAAFWTKMRDAGVVVIWDAVEFEKQVGPANTIVAYGPWVVRQGGPVATYDGIAQRMTSEDLKAKLAAMGKTPEEPKGAPPAEEAAPAEGAVPATPAEGTGPAAEAVPTTPAAP